MRTRITTVLFLLLFTVSASAQKDPAAAVRKVMDDQAIAWNRGDLEGFMLGYWKSPELKFVSRDRVTKGWQQTLDNYKRNYATKELMGTLTFSELDINVISKDAAFVIGNWSLARDKDNPKGKFTLLFRKFKEGWRIVTDHTS
jgi:ketosteroid isomerase-like protein